MPIERIQTSSIDFLKLWMSISDKDTNEARKKELKTLRTSLSPTAINKLFPEPSKTCPHYSPFITTPTMLEDFIIQWNPEWENRSYFSLMPVFQSLIGRLRDVEGEPYIPYDELRSFYRILMMQNLLQTGWRPERADFESQFRQVEKDREFKGRLNRLVKETSSNTWSFFSNKGYEIWKIGQAEILAYMETESPLWRKIFHQTQKDLRGR